MKKNLIISIFVFSLLLILPGAGCGSDKGENPQVLSGTTSASSSPVNTEANNKRLLEYAITTGPKDTTVTIIEASDFECPACRSIQPEFAKVIEKYRDRVQFGYVAFPLSYHKSALPAALAVEAAQQQGKGWEMYEKFFEGSTFDESKIDQIAKDLGLDMDKFNTDKASDTTKAKIDGSMNLLETLNLQGTPTFYVNGTEFNGNPTFSGFEAEIKKLLKIE